MEVSWGALPRCARLPGGGLGARAPGRVQARRRDGARDTAAGRATAVRRLGALRGAGRRIAMAVVGAGLALAAAGGFGLLALQPAAEATRFGRVTEVVAIAAAAGVAAALGSLALPGLGLAASAIGVLALAAPTLAGHSLDPRRYRALIALADFAHLAAAAVWIGGL